MIKKNKTREGHVHAAGLEWQDMGDGTRRKILGYEPQMLMMRNVFEAGGARPAP